MVAARLSTVVLDAHDAHELAGFYRRLLGYEVRAEAPDWVLIGPRPAPRASRSPSRPNGSTYAPSGPPAPPVTSG